MPDSKEYNLEYLKQEQMRNIAPKEPEALSLGDLIKPLFNRIAVQVETKKELMPSGLYIPIETARTVHEQRATQGTVVAVSWADDEDEGDDDLESAPHRVSVGDVVLFGKYTGTSIFWQPDRTQDRQQVILMQEKDVLAVLLSPEQARNIKVKA